MNICPVDLGEGHISAWVQVHFKGAWVQFLLYFFLGASLLCLSFPKFTKLVSWSKFTIFVPGSKYRLSGCLQTLDIF